MKAYAQKSEKQEELLEKIQQDQAKLRRLIPALLDKWKTELREHVEAANEAVKGRSDKHLDFIDQEPSNGADGALGFRLGRFDWCIRYGVAYSLDPPGKVFTGFKTSVTSGRNDFSSKLEFQKTLEPIVVGDQACFILSDVKPEVPLDPGEFWDDTLQRAIAVG